MLLRMWYTTVMGDKQANAAVPPPSDPTPAASMSEDQLLLAFVQDRDVSCLLCGYNLRALTMPRCPECGNALRSSVGCKILPLHLIRHRIHSHVRCSGCKHDLAALFAEWFPIGVSPPRLCWTVACPECGLRQNAPEPLITEGFSLRAGRRAVHEHIRCTCCDRDLAGLLAEWFREDRLLPRLRWTVVCPECGLRQDAPDPPDPTLVNCVLC
jgi:hypothetical protein